MPSVTFRLKEPNSLNPTLIYLFFRANNLDVKYSTSQTIAPKFWNPERQRVKETRQFAGYAELNALLNNLDNCISNAYRKFINDGIVPTPDLLKNELNVYLQKETKIEKNLISIGEYVAESTDRKPGTTKQLKQTIRILKEFKQSTNCNLHLDSINLNFYDKFLDYLTDRKYKRNSIGSHIKNIKVFMNEALDRKLTTNVQFKNKRFKKIEEESQSIYLTVPELEKIYKHDFSNDKTLEKVRDLFIVGCYTGLRFSDLVKLTKENIINDGLQIKITTQKTGETVVIPIKSIVKEIFHKYDGKLPSLISNQKMNEYLKLIGEGAGIEGLIPLSFTKGSERQTKEFKKYKLITTHTARRSFATNAFLNDVPAIAIMKITGHKTERSFLKYIKATPEQNANKLINHKFFA